MTNNLNAIHGPSVLLGIKFDAKVIASWIPVVTSDPQFEITYVARETYADGHKVIAVAYLISDPTPQPPAKRNQPVKKLPPLNLMVRVADTGQPTE